MVSNFEAGNSAAVLRIIYSADRFVFQVKADIFVPGRPSIVNLSRVEIRVKCQHGPAKILADGTGATENPRD